MEHFGRVAIAFTGFALIVAWWATGLDPFSVGATVAVLGAGLVAVGVGRAMAPVASGRRVSVRAAAPWLAVVAALAAWQLAAYIQHPRRDHPTLSALVNTVLDPRPVRSVAFALWLLGAAWLGRRR